MGSLPETTPQLPENQELQTPLPQLSAQLSALLRAGSAGNLNTIAPAGSSNAKNETVIIVEGIPPIAKKLLEKIRRWELIDLADLLTDMLLRQEESPVQCDSADQVILVQTVDQIKRKKKRINDVTSWVQAFTVYMAALTSSEDTSKEEAAGLAAHMYAIIQLSQDLGGLRWYKYDQDFRAWAAAKRVRVWGELNLSIYGRCLIAPRSDPPPSDTSKGPPKQGMEKRQKPVKSPRNKCCFKHNFEGACPRSEAECFFEHSCWHCGDSSHVAGDCPRAPKRRVPKADQPQKR